MRTDTTTDHFPQDGISPAAGAPRRAEATLRALFLDYVAQAPDAPAIHGYAAGATSVVHSRAGLLAAAAGVARCAIEHDVRAGDRVLIALEDPVEFATAFWGAQLCGTVAVPLAPIVEAQPSTGDFAKRVQEICGARLLLSRGDGLGNAAGLKVASPSQWSGCDVEDKLQPDPEAEEPAVIQFTSGSTSEPKGCVLTNRAVSSNARSILRRTRTTPLDTGVCWLPLHHDMGLMSGVVTPVLGGAATCLFPTSRFLANPIGWLTALAAFRRSHTAVPNFALAVVLQRLSRRRPEGLDLSGVQTILCGAEPIDVPLVRDFLGACAPYGLRPEAFHAAYGMSETTVMATSKPGGLRLDEVDTEALQVRGLAAAPLAGAPTTALANVGAPPDDGAVRIVSDAGEPLPDRTVGHIQLRSSGQMSGYLDDPESTRAAFENGWLKTGDLGYLAAGDLFVTGRLNERIIVGGRNLAPSDLELAVTRLVQLPPGRVAALGRRTPLGTQEIVLVVETRDAGSAGLRAAVARACFEACGLAPGAVELVDRGALPRTSSGKIRRLELQARFADPSSSGGRAESESDRRRSTVSDI